ncbi:hypothetical protein GS462_11315 [Rhodococcus hoagii]|nr:hypothetical protein [Prescottella equi]MBM4651001.1 hypothetical protein [Prescottella equi]MBM4686652.1 hypothetical protein [Prescottella equi]
MTTPTQTVDQLVTRLRSLGIGQLVRDALVAPDAEIAQSKIAELIPDLANKADLDSNGILLQAQVPALALTDYLGEFSSEQRMLTDSAGGQRGDWCTRSDLGTDWKLIADDPTKLSSWREHTYPQSGVRALNGRTGSIELSTLDLLDSTALGRILMKVANAAAVRAAAGLDQVDNTRDLDKPVPTAMYQMFIDFETTVASLMARKLSEGGAWSPTKNYSGGEVVSYGYQRWYCRDGHAASASFPVDKFVRIGLDAVVAASDPGGGQLWVKY